MFFKRKFGSFRMERINNLNSKIFLNSADLEGIFNPYETSWGKEIIFPSTRKLCLYGNRIYNRYPARSIFLVPRSTLHFLKNSKKLNVLDPFMGAGTTAVETKLSNNIPFGVEMNPFARIISDVSSTVYTKNDFAELDKIYENIISNFKIFSKDEVPHLRGIERWFKTKDFEELLKLKKTISEIVPQKFYNFFIITFADCIKPVSLMERQSTKPYISSKYVKTTKSVIESFEYSFKAHRVALFEMSKKCNFITNNNNIKWIGNDATNFSNKESEIDIAITSPPYINAFDYTQCTKVEAAMCGFIDDDSAAILRKQQVGHDNRRKQDIAPEIIDCFKEQYCKIYEKDKIKADTCQAYFNDIYKNLNCVFNILKEGGEYHIIVGNNTIKDIYIPCHEIIANIAEEIGFKWFGYYKYQIKDHRTSIPRANAKEKIKVEHVIMLKKLS